MIGAPLVAREVEQRTQLAAWTQSVSRRHPAGQYWPLQLILLTVLLTLAAAALASGWHATRTRAV